VFTVLAEAGSHAFKNQDKPNRHALLAVFTVLAEAGFHVFAYDAHGHGGSEPREPERRALILDASHLLEDSEDFLDAVVAPGAVGLPLFGVAHSLGAGVLCLLEARRPGTFEVRAKGCGVCIAARTTGQSLGRCWPDATWIALWWDELSSSARSCWRHVARWSACNAQFETVARALQGLAFNSPALGRRFSWLERIVLAVIGASILGGGSNFWTTP
jgi:pimeloyl-ACP methyl ester carboxylesterase